MVLKLIEKIALRKGIGDRLALGVARLLQQIPGSSSFAMHVKGLELAAYDPRAVFGQALSYAIAPRGGERGRGGYMIVEFFMSDVNLYTHEGKAERAAYLSENACIYDMLCECSFNFLPVELVPELLSAVVGKEYTAEQVREGARRTITLERMFNLREGFSRKDDTLPPRLLNEPLPEGMAAGMKVDESGPRLSFFFNSHSDFLEEVAKFRAARRLWAKIMKERFNAQSYRTSSAPTMRACSIFWYWYASCLCRFASWRSGNSSSAR